MDKILNQIKTDFLQPYQANTQQSAWKIPKNVPVSLPDGSPYERHIALKFLLKPLLENSSNLDCHYWIMREWGGIKGLKRGQKNDEILCMLPEMLASGKLSAAAFDNISSFSKVASFLEPERYAIYDSRVIFSLNWLFFKHYGNEYPLFHQPQGRNAKLAQYHLSTLFALSGMETREHSKESAYHIYCEWMRDWSRQIFGEKALPYEMEMLLFYIAPDWITKDIQKSVKLVIG